MILDRLTNVEVKKFIYTENVKRSYLGGSICGGKLKGKQVLVTGATGGIGEALVQRFLIERATVYLTGRDISKLKMLKEKMLRIYPNSEIEFLQIDNLDLDNLKRELDLLLARQKIDILVNNSGVVTDVDRNRLFRGVSEEQFDLVWRTNYIATKEISEIMAKSMNKMGGCIINVSSICAISSKFKQTPYGMSKNAVLGIKREIERKYENVVVNSILPGTVATKMSGTSLGDDITIKRNKIRRAALPEEIASIVAWMCSVDRLIKSPYIVSSANEIL